MSVVDEDVFSYLDHSASYSWCWIHRGILFVRWLLIITFTYACPTLSCKVILPEVVCFITVNIPSEDVKDIILTVICMCVVVSCWTRSYLC